MSEPLGQSITIEFELSSEDLLALSEHFNRHSGTVRRQYRTRWYMLALAILLLSVSVYMRAFDSTLPGDEIMIVGAMWLGFLCIICVIALPLSRYRRRGYFLNILKEGQGKNLYGQRSITLMPTKIHEARQFGYTGVHWMGVERVARTDEHLFVYVSATTAFVIPKRAFRDEGAFRQFVDTAQAYHRAVAPGLCKKCGYDLTGNVSGRCSECGKPITN